MDAHLLDRYADELHNGTHISIESYTEAEAIKEHFQAKFPSEFESISITPFRDKYLLMGVTEEEDDQEEE